jgi:hypothetical protein
MTTDDLTSLTDEELLKRFHECEGYAGEPEADALAAEVQRRELDF